ncbi:MAG: acyl carrier protein [bacterium]
MILEGIHQIAPEAELESLQDDAEFRRELEIDSFDFLRLLVFVNERLKVDFPETDYGGLTSVSKLVSYVSRKLLPSSPVG